MDILFNCVQLRPVFVFFLLTEMLKDKKVFPTKSTSWVTLARNPVIPDDKTLEKVFRSYSNVCLLSLPPPNKPKIRSAQGTVPSAIGVPRQQHVFEAELAKFLR